MENQTRVFIIIIFLLGSLGISLYFKNLLPEKVPQHFNGRGYADCYGSKQSALISHNLLMGFVGGMYLLSFYLMQSPKYWKKRLRKPVSESAQKLLIAQSLKIVDWSLIMVLILFLDLQIEAYLVALGKIEKLTGLIWGITGVLIISGIYHSIRLFQLQSKVQKELEFRSS